MKGRLIMNRLYLQSIRNCMSLKEGIPRAIFIKSSGCLMSANHMRASSKSTAIFISLCIGKDGHLACSLNVHAKCE